MNKLKKLSVLAFAAFSLIVSSCQTSVEDNSPDEGMKLDKDIAYIRISVGNASSDPVSRTVIPTLTKEADYAGFEKFVLQGVKKSSDYEINLFWTTDNESTAYSKMTAAIIPLPTLLNDGDTDIWDFELIGYYAGTFEEGVYKDDGTVYCQQLMNKTLTKGYANKLSFELERTTQYEFAGVSKGKIKFDLTFADSTQVAKVNANLFAYEDRTNSVKSDTFNVSQSKATISFDELDAGKYVLEMEFTKNEIRVGTHREYVYILPGLTSSLAENIGSINVNATYKIQYYYNTEDDEIKSPDFWPFGTNTVPVNYSRLNREVLPKASDFDDEFVREGDASPFNDLNIFLGWYTESDFDSSSLKLTIEQNTDVKDLKLYGKFIQKNEMPTITGFDFICDEGAAPSTSTLKVGHTVTAIPKAGDADFLGTVEDWKWYYGSEEEGWTEISGTDGATSVDEHPATDGVAAKSTLTIKPLYADKKLKVVARQKYRITGPNADGIYDMQNNSATKETSTDFVAKGQLAVGNVVLEYLDIIVRGNALQNRFAIKSGALTDEKSTGWTYDKDAVTSVSYSGSINAPADSSKDVENIPVSFSVPGYEIFTPNRTVFINVKYAAPTAESTVPATVPALHRLPYEVTYNKMKFDSASEVVQYKVGSGSWNAITTSEFESGTVQVRYAAVGTKDNAGYICESEPFILSSENAVGKKVLLKQVTYSGDVKVCGTITATASPDFTDTPGINWLAADYGFITWNWYAGEDCVKTEEGTHSTTSSLTVVETLRTRCYGKTLKAEAVYTYIADGGSTNVTKDVSCGTVGKGELRGGAFTYNGRVPVVVGSSLDRTKLTVGGITNSLGEAVEITTGNCTFVSAEAPSVPGNETVNVSVTGYESHTVDVYINVCSAPPEVSSGTGDPGTSFALSQNRVGISLEYALFTNVSEAARYKWEYRRSGESAEENSNWHAVTEWEFKAPTLSEYFNVVEATAVFVREKLSGVIGDTRYYYDSETGIWRAQASGGMIYEQVEFGNNGNEKYATVKDLDGIEYTVEQIVEASGEACLLFDISAHGGIRALGGLEIEVVHIDMVLNSSKANGKVTVSPKTGYSVNAWRIDGLSVSQFNALETVSGNAVTSITGENASLVLTLDGLKEGTYQVTAYATGEDGITYNASASIVVSK